MCDPIHCIQVLVGTHVVLANGGIMAPVGTHIVALAAKHHSCPFVVLTGLHKLSPLFPHDPSVNFNEFRVGLFWLSGLIMHKVLVLSNSICSISSLFYELISRGRHMLCPDVCNDC